MADFVVENVQLRLMYELGLDEDGNVKYQTKNYNNIKVNAEATALVRAAQAIASLQTKPVSSVRRSEMHFLS
jgi:hypothetical protein